MVGEPHTHTALHFWDSWSVVGGARLAWASLQPTSHDAKPQSDLGPSRMTDSAFEGQEYHGVVGQLMSLFGAQTLGRRTSKHLESCGGESP